MEIATIPYFAHEGIVTRLERTNRKLMAALAVSLIALAVETTILINQRDDEEDV